MTRRASKRDTRTGGSPNPVTAAQWRKLADSSLRGRNYDDLAWHTDDGFVVEPLQTTDDLADASHLAGGPAALLARRRGWALRERIADATPEAASEHAARATAGGAEQLEFELDDHAKLQQTPCADAVDEDDLAGAGGIALYSADDFARALNGVDFGRVSLTFAAGPAAPTILDYLKALCQHDGTELSTVHGELGFDPFWQESELAADVVWDTAASLIGETELIAPAFRPLALSGVAYHRAGAAPGIEIGCTMAAAIATMRCLSERGVEAASVTSAIVFRFEVATDFISQIAKLRAARLVWAKIAAAFAAGDGAMEVPFGAYTSTRSIAHWHDLHTNLLRTSVAATAAVLGGCDSLCIEPRDPDPDYQDAAMQALARQQHHLLREEGFVGAVADPLAGSVSVERLTHQIAAAAWATLQEIERRGGLLTEAGDGYAWQTIAIAAAARRQRFRRRQQVMIGISRYVDRELEGERQRFVDRTDLHQQACAGLAEAIDNTEHEREFESEGDEHEQRDDLLLLRSDGQEFEELRAVEDTIDGCALLLPIGAVRARVDFARDLLHAGGLEVNEAPTSTDVDAALRQLAQTDATLIVLCAADSAYAELVPQFHRSLQPGAVLVAVGNPGDDAAVDATIYDGVDAIALMEYLTMLQTARLLASDGETDRAARRIIDDHLRPQLDEMRNYLKRRSSQ